MIIVSVFDEEKTILQQFVSVVKIFAEKRAARLRERSLFHFAPDAAKRLAYLPKDVFLVGLHFRDFRAQHVRLFAVFEMLPAGPNPILALHQDARKLDRNFGCKMLDQRELVQNVAFDGLLKLGASDRGLQNFGQKLAERAMFRRAGLFAVFTVK